MFNVIVSANYTAWEGSQLSMHVSRFKEYSGVDASAISLDKPDSLRQLENVPTLLIYEVEVCPSAGVVRHGRLKNIACKGGEITFGFEPDSKKAYFNRRLCLKYADRFGIGDFELTRTHWAIKDGDFPIDLLDSAVAELPFRTLYSQTEHKCISITSIHLTNFLSYDPNAKLIELKPLNVLIGPNGSGKSNFLEAFSLLQSTPQQIARPVSMNGGVRNWIFQGNKPNRNAEPARLEVLVDYGIGKLRYALAFDEVGNRFTLVNELLEEENRPYPFDDGIYYQWQDGHPIISARGIIRDLARESLNPELSILAQKRDADYYRELTEVAEFYGRIKLYREWTFGPYAKQRSQARSDLPNQGLEPDGSNLGLILNGLRRNYDNYQDFLESLKILYPGIRDVDIHVEGGNVQIFLQEKNGPIPASRLSDGTLRYLFLLALLYDPNPPPLICLEEPELGLHPDVLPTLARLLHQASERTQLIVTTHSPILIDALSETPESILVCEQTEEGSTIQRLDGDELKPWLEKYRLGQLWMRGDLGGTRW